MASFRSAVKRFTTYAGEIPFNVSRRAHLNHYSSLAIDCSTLLLTMGHYKDVIVVLNASLPSFREDGLAISTGMRCCYIPALRHKSRSEDKQLRGKQTRTQALMGGNCRHWWFEGGEKGKTVCFARYSRCFCDDLWQKVKSQRMTTWNSLEMLPLRLIDNHSEKILTKLLRGAQ